MFDIGWSELLIIGLVALIVVGPKDLPIMFRKIGQWVGRLRKMAREFQRAMDDAADQAGVKDIKDGLKDATNMQDKIFGDAADSLKSFQNEVEGSVKEPKKIDAAAEHAKRMKMAEDANKAAENWTDPTKSTAGDLVDEVPTQAEKPAPKKKSATKPKAKSAAAKSKTPSKAKTASKKSSAKKAAT